MVNFGEVNGKDVFTLRNGAGYTYDLSPEWALAGELRALVRIPVHEVDPANDSDDWPTFIYRLNAPGRYYVRFSTNVTGLVLRSQYVNASAASDHSGQRA